QSFNIYAAFMTSNPLIKIISVVNYAFILIHIIWSIIITRRNRAARGPVGYALNRNSSHWTSRNMGILGTFIFIFLVIHLRSFWYEMHWGDIPIANYDGVDYKNLYHVVDVAYASLWFVLLYVTSMAL